MTTAPMRTLLSLPQASASAWSDLMPSRSRDVFASCDPPGRQIGSGGGTVHLLYEAWKARATKGQSFLDWIRAAPTLVLHGGGESRRLPAYAAPGKPLVPLPRLSDVSAQRPDQFLLDLQQRACRRFLWHAGPDCCVMVACGDVVLHADSAIPPTPSADVVIVGLTTSPDEASHHGVMFCPEGDPHRLSFFLQKPTPERIMELSGSHSYYLDTGLWLLSEKALLVLLAQCGWDDEAGAFRNGIPDAYDLYGEFGPAMGDVPAASHPDVSPLKAAVVPLAHGRFYHFGTNASLLSSVQELRSPAVEQKAFGHAVKQLGPVVVNSDVACALPATEQIWIENSSLPPSWVLSDRHVVTGVPPNDWPLSLEEGVCLDCVPIDETRVCLRLYGFADLGRGSRNDGKATWFGRPLPAWFKARGLDPAAAGIPPDMDIHEAPLFPVVETDALDPGFLTWMSASEPDPNKAFAETWLRSERCASRDLLSRTDMAGQFASRRDRMAQDVRLRNTATWMHDCTELDLDAAAELQARCGWPPPPELPETGVKESLCGVHDAMFRFACARHENDTSAQGLEDLAFHRLRELLLERMKLETARPHRSLLDDQIVWGRSPIRLDLAGGWSDTPPYCLEHGGRVVNVAVELNGQPPIQVFGRTCARPEIVLRSIDLGIDETIREYEDLAIASPLGSGFGIARAALALAGFDPRFQSGSDRGSLAQQLEKDMGGGIELSLLAAVPKGSGLGTSSILAATVLGTLSEMCGLGWTTRDLSLRTLALEQMLTSGGGWQDQVGGLLPGVKIVETTPGLLQVPTARWLPGRFFADDYANTRTLLYYTGLTRVARSILSEIVRGMFLNAGSTIALIEEIAWTATQTADALQRNSWEDLCEGVRRSWCLNQRLDAGTNPAQVQRVLDPIADYVAAAKLLGAGGGGYMLILAKDESAGQAIRQILTENPPNDRARFADVTLSEDGFQVTRS